MTQKVFCIGFQKTGKSSLGVALSQFGYRVKVPVKTSHHWIFNRLLEETLPLVDKFDAFQDSPWPILYRELDERYPSSRFILTIRELIYGAGFPLENEELYRQRFLRNQEEVLDYLKNHPNDLLVLNLKTPDPWQSLCGFLNKPIPNCLFPHVNQSTSRKLEKSPSWKIWWRRLRDAI